MDDGLHLHDAGIRVDIPDGLDPGDRCPDQLPF